MTDSILGVGIYHAPRFLCDVRTLFLLSSVLLFVSERGGLIIWSLQEEKARQQENDKKAQARAKAIKEGKVAEVTKER